MLQDTASFRALLTSAYLSTLVRERFIHVSQRILNFMPEHALTTKTHIRRNETTMNWQHILVVIHCDVVDPMPNALKVDCGFCAEVKCSGGSGLSIVVTGCSGDTAGADVAWCDDCSGVVEESRHGIAWSEESCMIALRCGCIIQH